MIMDISDVREFDKLNEEYRKNENAHTRNSLIKWIENYVDKQVNELNERNSVDEGEKLFSLCSNCNTPHYCNNMKKCYW